MIDPCFLRFCNLLSSCICATAGEVWAVKVKLRLDCPLLFMIWLIILVLPVPVGAVRKMGLSSAMKFSTMVL